MQVIDEGLEPPSQVAVGVLDRGREKAKIGCECCGQIHGRGSGGVPIAALLLSVRRQHVVIVGARA